MNYYKLCLFIIQEKKTAVISYFNISGIIVAFNVAICIKMIKTKCYKRKIIISATAVFDKENFDAKIPTNICSGVAVIVLYNNKEFVIP
jgi:hypothetical protein